MQTGFVGLEIDGGEYGGPPNSGGITGAGTGDAGDTGGNGDIDGAGAGTGGKRRGRPKKGGQLAGEVAARPVEIPIEPVKPAAKRRSKSASLASAVDATVAGVFNITAVLTSHRHWLKDAEEVKPITEPINAWMDQLPAKQLKAFEERICPILLGVGLATVLVPDIVLEMKIRASNRHPARPEAEAGNGHYRSEAGSYPIFGRGYDGRREGFQPSQPAADDGDGGRPPEIPGIPF